MNATTEQLYEQAKRVIRNMVLDQGLLNEGDTAFIVACDKCGLPFSKDAEIGMIGEHASISHGINTDNESVGVELIWIGEGPPPEPQR